MEVSHADFLALLAPSFAGVEDAQDMAAILPRTHLIVLTDSGVYYRVASTQEQAVQFLTWPDSTDRDLLAASYRPVFHAYKKNPSMQTLPESFHADSAWSQELLRRLLNGESIPRTMTIRGHSVFGQSREVIQKAPELLSNAEMQVKVKTEQCNQAFKHLKSFPIGHTIELDSPSPVKRRKSSEPCLAEGASSSALPSNLAPENPDNLPGLQNDDPFPVVGGKDDLEIALEEALEEALHEE